MAASNQKDPILIEITDSTDLVKESVYQDLLRAGILCNDASVAKNAPDQFIGDPVDTALMAAAEKTGVDVESERNQYPKIGELPFDSDRKLMTTVHRHNGSLISYTKGAPGMVLDKSISRWDGKTTIPLDEASCQSIQNDIQQLQNEGMYTLALASKAVSTPRDEPILNEAMYATIAGSVFRTLIAYSLIFWAGLKLGGVDYARTMLFTSIVLHAFTRVMVVRQMDSLSIWSNRALVVSNLAAVGLQLLALYTPLRSVFGIVYLDWRAWAVMIPVVVGSSLAGIYMPRWILKLIPLWEN